MLPGKSGAATLFTLTPKAAQSGTFVSVAKCEAAGTPGSAKQQWTFPLSAAEPYLAFAGPAAARKVDTDVNSAAGASAAAAADSASQMCIQINGAAPWTGNRAVVWDCEANSWDEVVQLLPGAGQGLHKIMIDMSSGGGGKLCASTRLHSPAPVRSCDELGALRFTITEAAAGAPAPQIRSFAVY